MGSEMCIRDRCDSDDQDEKGFEVPENDFSIGLAYSEGAEYGEELAALR